MSTSDPRTERAQLDKWLLQTNRYPGTVTAGEAAQHLYDAAAKANDALTTEAARVRGELEARKDAAYQERNQVVAALSKCFPSGVARTAIEGWSEDWHGCVYIDLPTGQASWHFHDSQAHLFAHLPPYRGTWDGHTTEMKYERVAALTTLKPSPWSTARPTREGWYWYREKGEKDGWPEEVVRSLEGALMRRYEGHIEPFDHTWDGEWCPIERPSEEVG